MLASTPYYSFVQSYTGESESHQDVKYMSGTSNPYKFLSGSENGYINILNIDNEGQVTLEYRITKDQIVSSTDYPTFPINLIETSHQSTSLFAAN